MLNSVKIYWLQVEVFCVQTPFSDVVGYQRFGGPCCLHLQGEITIFIVVETSYIVFSFISADLSFHFLLLSSTSFVRI
jgi:hypothetical protein